MRATLLPAIAPKGPATRPGRPGHRRAVAAIAQTARHAAPGRRPRPGARRLEPRAPPPRRRRDRLPGGLPRLPHACRDGRRRSRRSPPPTRRSCARSRSARAHQGRELLAAKVSDNVATDEAEPEAYIDGLTHGNEPMSLEMTIRILRWLAEGYGSDSRITGHRRPDRGLDRVRRQPRRPGVRLSARARSATGARTASRTPARPRSAPTSTATTAIAGAARAPSSSPGSIKYRGAAAFSAPETRAVRDFLAQPGRRRPAADQGGDLVPRVRALCHVAVRGDTRQPPVRHDEPGPGGAGHDRQGDGQPGTATSPMQASDLYVASRHHRGLAVRHVPALRVHRRAVRQSTIRRTPRSRPRRAATRTRSCTCSSGRGARWRS